MGFDAIPFASNRREYGERSLDEHALLDSPIAQFERWFADALSEKIADPTAMVLSTVDARGCPNSRVVLLKGIEDNAFIFFTNYESEKSLELQHTPYAALNFYWAKQARQVRIRGPVQRVPEADSAAYFKTRSLMSQCSAVVSPQSRVIASRNDLLEAAEALKAKQAGNPLPCPSYWGGFSVRAETVEFWQGRDHRLHDRILYTKVEGHWRTQRLAS